MKRGLGILILALVLAAIAAGVAYRSTAHRATPMGWLQREFSLTEEQAGRAAAIYSDYEKHCRQMCAKIAVTDRRLAELIRTHASVTPEIREAIAETDRVRTECRTEMLGHFYQIAAELPPERREKYLSMVLPDVLHPGEMAQSHSH